MIRNLYILRYKSTPLLVFENKKMKYFEEDNKDSFEGLEKYLKNKMEYQSLVIVNEKKAIYYNEEYVVKIIDVLGLNEIKDNKNIKQLNTIENGELDNKDEMFLNMFYLNGMYTCKNKNVEINEIEKRDIKLNILLAIVVAFVSMIFLIGKDNINYLGISVPIITMIVTVAAILTMGEIKKINYFGLYFVVAAMFLSISYGIFDNSIFRTINIIFIPITLLTGLYMINFYNTKFNLSQLLYNIFPTMIINIVNDSYIRNIGKLIRGRKKGEYINNKNKGIIKGIFISIPILVVLIILLASSDQMFKSIIEDLAMNIEDSLIDFNFKFIFFRIIIFTVVFIYMFYVFSSFKFRVDNIKIRKVATLEKNMVNTILVLINALYLLFTYVQVKYLYIKSNNTLAAEEYSSYARSGFFQLMIVVVINIVIIIYFKNRVENNKLTNILNTIMTILSMNMSFTSMYKMVLYINQFGMTRLRFMTSIFMMFVLIMLIIISISLWKSVELFKWFVLIGSIVYISINFCNMDRIIAGYNLSEKAKEVDISYLETLSMDCYDIVVKAYEDGKIDHEQFTCYKNKKIDTSKWYEYNYYNNKM